MNRIDPRCRCGHDRLGHSIESPHPCKTCGPRCTEWRRDFDRERRLRETDNRRDTVGKLITPERAAVIRRAALRHAAGMLRVSLVEWDASEYFPDAAEEELLCEEVERIADELRSRSLVGTRRPCSVCGFPYLVRTGGAVGWHNGVDAAGFSSGERCPGVGEPPRTS